MKIKSAKFVDSEEMVYDIEVDTKDHTFMIGNTRVENCRLRSDLNGLKKDGEKLTILFDKNMKEIESFIDSLIEK